MIHLKLTLLATMLFLPLLGQAQTITYLGNEGVLIQNGQTKVMVDALFDEYNLRFHAPSANLMTKIMTQTAPYDGVDLVLVTHAHRDHFNAQIAVDYLNSNKEALMIVPPQAIDSMKQYPESFAKVKDRVNSFPWKKGWRQATFGEISIKTTYMLHAGKSNKYTQNAIYIINIGGKQVIHLGDTQMERDHFDNLRLEYENFDAAIVPFWYLTSVYGAELVRKFMHSKEIIGVHFPKKGFESSISKVKENFSSAILFTDIGQKQTF